MITKAQAKALRAAMVKSSPSLSDEDALSAPMMFDKWKTDTEYKEGDRRRYDGVLYKCLQAHTSQDTWTPADAPSLWARVDDPSIEWPDWVQPTGATDAYAQGAKVSHNEKHWISDVDNNVWEPGVYGWTEAEE